MTSPPAHYFGGGKAWSAIFHAEGLTHFINDAAHKVGTPIAQEPGWGPKD